MRFKTFMEARQNILYHGTTDDNFKLSDKPIFLAQAEDEAATYAGGGYEWMTHKPKEGRVFAFYAKPGKTLDLNNDEVRSKAFKDMYGSPELKAYYDKIPDSYTFLTDELDRKTIYPKKSKGQFDTWAALELQSNPKIKDGLKIQTGSYSFDDKQIVSKYMQAFTVYSYAERHEVYSRWNDIIDYARQKGYDYIEHTTEDPSAQILFPEIVAINPLKSLTPV